MVDRIHRGPGRSRLVMRHEGGLRIDLVGDVRPAGPDPATLTDDALLAWLDDPPPADADTERAMRHEALRRGLL